MTEESKREPRKLTLNPQWVEGLKAAGMSDYDLQMLTLMQVTREAIEEQLAEKQPDGTWVCVQDAAMMVHLFVRLIAFYLGLTKAFDDPKELMGAVTSIAKEIFAQTLISRDAYKSTPLDDRTVVIDVDETHSHTLN